MINVTPFNNPFRPTENFGKTDVVKTVVKNGKTYKKIEKKIVKSGNNEK